jgi:hypothetical protein
MSKERKSHIVQFGKQVAYGMVKGGIKRYFNAKNSGRGGNRRGRKRRRTATTRKQSMYRSKAVAHRAQVAYQTSKKNRMDMKQMKCFINQRTAIHIHRIRDTGSLVTSGVNNQARHNITCGGGISKHEAAAANLRYWNPQTNTLVGADPTIGTYSRDLCISISRKLLCRNNYQVPCHIQIWNCIPKTSVDVGDTPNSLWQNGLTDQMATPASNSPMMYISDVDDLKNLWQINCLVNRQIQPGQEVVATSVSERFDYTIATNDAHADEYQKRQGGHIFLMRITGVLQHDSGGVAEVALGRAGIDWMCDVTYKFEYDAGKDLHEYSIVDNSATGFTTAGVLSARPVVDNQSYSVS